MAKVVFTHDDYVELSKDQDLELIEGQLFVSPSPVWEHQAIAFELAFQLRRLLGERGRVVHEMDVRFENSTVRPDVIFVSHERAHIVKNGQVVGPPDLVVEVLSPASAARDRELKRRVYEANGVGEYWIVSPEAQTVQVVTFGGDARVYGSGERLHSAHLEIDLDLAAVFS